MRDVVQAGPPTAPGPDRHGAVTLPPIAPLLTTPWGASIAAGDCGGPCYNSPRWCVTAFRRRHPGMAQRPSSPSGTLTADRLERLLRALDGDRDAAAHHYAMLVRRLVAFFGWQGCADADHLADEVMDRVARRLSEGEPVAKVTAYALGVARLVAREAHARQVRDERVAHDFDHLTRSTTTPDDAALACLDGCLNKLPPERRRELLDYYAADIAGRIAGRKRQAESLGVSPLALRNRMLRLRQGLEACVLRCLDEARHGEPGSGSTRATRTESRR